MERSSVMLMGSWDSKSLAISTVMEKPSRNVEGEIYHGLRGC